MDIITAKTGTRQDIHSCNDGFRWSVEDVLHRKSVAVERWLRLLATFPLTPSLVMCLLVSILAMSIFCSHAEAMQDWLLSYKDKSTNTLVWDKQHRFQALLKASMPAHFVNVLQQGFSGPPDPVIISHNRYVSVSACEVHSCPEKSFFWYDTKTGIAVGATLGHWQMHFKTQDTVSSVYFDHPRLTMASNVQSVAKLPADSISRVLSWLHQHDASPSTVTFMNRAGHNQALPAALFISDPFIPPSTGPSFDCTQVYSRIDKAICHNPVLSQQDINTSILARKISNGTSTESAHQQLQTLQLRWLSEREKQCYNATNLDACLSDSYKAQQNRLKNWVPD